MSGGKHSARNREVSPGKTAAASERGREGSGAEQNDINIKERLDPFVKELILMRCFRNNTQKKEKSKSRYLIAECKPASSNEASLLIYQPRPGRLANANGTHMCPLYPLALVYKVGEHVV